MLLHSAWVSCVCVCARARVVERRINTHTCKHEYTHVFVWMWQRSRNAEICYLTDGCGRLSLRLNAPERDRESCLVGQRLRARCMASGNGLAPQYWYNASFECPVCLVECFSVLLHMVWACMGVSVNVCVFEARLCAWRWNKRERVKLVCVFNANLPLKSILKSPDTLRHTLCFLYVYVWEFVKLSVSLAVSAF